MPHRRRSLLRSGTALALTGVLAGCGRPSQPSVDDLRFEADRTQDTTAVSPELVSLRIENTTEDWVAVAPANHGAGPLEFVEPLTGDTGEVILLPTGRERVDVVGGDVTSYGGCWRVVDRGDEAHVSTISERRPVRVNPDETHVVLHGVYYHGPDDNCLPPGEYQTSIGIEVGTDSEDDFRVSDEGDLQCTLTTGADGVESVGLD